MKVWIAINDNDDILGVYGDPESADARMKELYGTVGAVSGRIEEHDVILRQVEQAGHPGPKAEATR